MKQIVGDLNAIGYRQIDIRATDCLRTQRAKGFGIAPARAGYYGAGPSGRSLRRCHYID
ncbi:hypothetical protein [Roseibium algae]|uniref:Uncharacterized protein n=1 Tax=Roseibium algae TaxID=3123038 RepID=A0ABU8TK12_9HYPH